MRGVTALVTSATPDTKADALVIGVAKGPKGLVLAPGSEAAAAAFGKKLLPTLTALGAFGAQIWKRTRLIFAAPARAPLGPLGPRVGRFVLDVLLQRQTIKERPLAGVAHALVFWGFLAFAGYTIVEFLWGLGIADAAHAHFADAFRKDHSGR